jgi:hypothetical protein
MADPLSKWVFLALVQLLVRFGLHGGIEYSAEFQLAVFLHFAATGNSVRDLSESFQCSKDTVASYGFAPL